MIPIADELADILVSDSTISQAFPVVTKILPLGVRYSTSLLASSANRLARRPLAKTTDGRREAAARCFVDEGGVLLSDLRLLPITTSSNERLATARRPQEWRFWIFGAIFPAPCRKNSPKNPETPSPEAPWGPRHFRFFFIFFRHPASSKRNPTKIQERRQ